MDHSIAFLAFTVGTFLLAGFVKGVIGMGLPTIGLGLLSLFVAPAQAAAVMIVPSFVTNVWQGAAGARLLALLRRLWPMLVGIGFGTWAGAGLLTGDNAGRAAAALGIALMVYAASGLMRLRFRVPPRIEIWLGPLVGVGTGVVTAATGVFAIPAVPYMQALGFEKDELVQAQGITYTVCTVALAGALAHGGIMRMSIAGASIAALLAALAGMWIGQRVRARVSPEIFRRWFFLGLLLLGAHLALRAML
jgi:hypothetical protein